jgi:hypothetical protein
MPSRSSRSRSPSKRHKKSHKRSKKSSNDESSSPSVAIPVKKEDLPNENHAHTVHKECPTSTILPTLPLTKLEHQVEETVNIPPTEPLPGETLSSIDTLMC